MFKRARDLESWCNITARYRIRNHSTDYCIEADGGRRAEISAELFRSKFQAKGLMQLSKTHCIEGFTQLAIGMFKANKSKGKLQTLEELHSKHGTSPLKHGNG